LRPTNKLCRCCAPRKKKPIEPELQQDEKDEPDDEEAAVAQEWNDMDVLPLQDASSADAAFFSAAAGFEDSDSDTEAAGLIWSLC